MLTRKETLYYANWELPVEFGKDGGHCPTPPSVLLHVRDALGAGFASAPSATEHLRPALVYIKRKQGEMRSVLHGEADFVQELKTWAPSVALEYITFNGQLKPKATARLFGRACIIVGFHGGALVNMLFSPTTCHVFELGFASPFAGHYRFLALVLGLPWARLPLRPDERGLAGVEASLEDPQGALREIKEAMSPMSTSEASLEAAVWKSPKAEHQEL